MLDIRQLTPLDASAHRALMLEAYEKYPQAFTTSHAERVGLPLSYWAERLAPGDPAPTVVFGAFDAGGRLAGVAGLNVPETRIRSRHKGLLFGMYVAPSARRHGAGRQLVQAVLDAARARPDLRLVQLTVTEGNDSAQALYERCGFKTFGVEPMAVCVDGRYFGKVHMWCELR